jgi:hypothetical protein
MTPTSMALTSYATTSVTIILTSYMTISIVRIMTDIQLHLPLWLRQLHSQLATVVAGFCYNNPIARQSGNQ